MKSANLKSPSSLCFVWAGYLVRRVVLPEFHKIASRTERVVQQTLLFGLYFLGL